MTEQQFNEIESKIEAMSIEEAQKILSEACKESGMTFDEFVEFIKSICVTEGNIK